MTAYCYARVTGPQDAAGWWPAEAVTAQADGTVLGSGFVAVFSANGVPACPGVIYAGLPAGWFVAVCPAADDRPAPKPADPPAETPC